MAKLNFGGLVQGALGNAVEVNAEELSNEYSKYLFEGEVIQNGFKLIRDVIIFTDIRIIFVDKQGASGKKTSIKSIYLSHIIDVEMETAGSGLDDSEITVTYLENVNRIGHNEIFGAQKFEFGKKMDITPLYRILGTLALKNRNEINGK
ncbi:PH domain-containing protein [Acetobacterium malicum]|uniref:PH domain-containing protein n=1 Tax=Acetobacterium malicum TaxID=52692 RepID=A0ABR6Z190_9FIRM|nr:MULTISPECIES: PH domain-containing protein [Acetobacterium]MBC3901041.1 PH domain-containing protein [Acetobacterium malicum]